jgi:hypothetical protein
MQRDMDMATQLEVGRNCVCTCLMNQNEYESSVLLIYRA